MLRALSEYVITGIKTTIPYHKKILTNEVFISGNFNTGFIAEHMQKKETEEQPQTDSREISAV
jgi:biotin carboxylase